MFCISLEHPILQCVSGLGLKGLKGFSLSVKRFSHFVLLVFPAPENIFE